MYLTSALAASTNKSYDSGVRAYKKFCKQVQVSPFPLAEIILEYFVTSLSRRVRAATIKCYLSGVQFCSIMAGYPQKISDMGRLYYLVRGIKRLEGRSPRQSHRPIRVRHLLKLSEFIGAQYQKFDRIMYRAVISLAFFGMLRCSEYTAPGDGCVGFGYHFN